jgi:hypothetical protein
MNVKIYKLILRLVLLASSLSTSISAQNSADKPTEIIMVSIDSSGTPGGSDSFFPSLSYSGDQIAFTADLPFFSPEFPGSGFAHFSHDPETAITSLVFDLDSTQPFSVVLSAADEAGERFVTFTSTRDDLVPEDTNGLLDVFLYDTSNGLVKRVSQTPGGEESDGGVVDQQSLLMDAMLRFYPLLPI